MQPIIIKDRVTGKFFEEKVYGGRALRFLYGDGVLNKLCQATVCKLPAVSVLAGWWYKRAGSKSLIRPFVEKFEIDSDEFAEPLASFNSFNDFFIRKLKPAARPIAEGNHVAVMPADGRYLFYQNVSQTNGFIIKGHKFDLGELVGSPSLAKNYENGSMVIARLCPSDYHRFHFPIQCKAGEAKLINGELHSVNPWALAKNVSYLTQNKRFVTVLESSIFGRVVYIEIGATNVGSVIQTYDPNQEQKKGEEKGYFEFGASCLAILFPEKSITFDSDLTDVPLHQEIRCLMGQSLGKGN